MESDEGSGEGKVKRRRLTLRDKLEIVILQSRCPICRKPLGDLNDLEWDHVNPLALGGEDAPSNIQAVHKDCHKLKTFGPGGEKRITTKGGDIHKIRKLDAQRDRHEEFRNLILSPDGKPKKERSPWGKGQDRKKPKYKRPTRAKRKIYPRNKD